MNIEELITKMKEAGDEMEATDGMNIPESVQKSVNEATIEDGTLGDIEVLLNKISDIGIVCRGNTYDSDNLGKEKTVGFTYVQKGNLSHDFKAPLDNEYDPKQIAKECAEILKQHIETAEDEILTLLNKYGYKK